MAEPDTMAGSGSVEHSSIMALPSPQTEEYVEDEEPVALEERDRADEIIAGFSLESNGARFRGPRSGRKIRVFEERFSSQLVLEDIPQGDDGKFQTEVRETAQASPALTLLRSIYAVIAAFMGGFLFILGFDILLFLFIHIVTAFNEDLANGLLDFVSAFLSVPVFVYSLAFIMTLVTNFVVDTFYGNPFLRSFGLGIVLTEWVVFVFYLGIPLLTLIITLFLGKSNWWELPLITWFASVLILWCFFSACVFYFEVTQCLNIERERRGEEDVTEHMQGREKIFYWLRIAKDATKSTMKIRLSGKESKYKKQKGNEKPEYEDRHNRCPVGLCSLITTKLPCYKQYDSDEEKKEMRSLGEVLGLTSYITRYSWSLDKLFCRSRGQTSTIFLTSGESRVNQRQIQSSIACRIIGDLLIYLFVIGLITWQIRSKKGDSMNTTVKVLAVLSFFGVVAFIIYKTKYLKEIYKDTSDQSGVIWTRFWEVRLINEPSDGFIWFCVAAEMILLYLWPLISLCAIQNIPSAVIFTFLGIFSGIRHYLNGAILLRAYEHGFFEAKQHSADRAIADDEKLLRRRRWKKKSRMYNMLRIGNTSRKFWIVVFCVLAAFFNLVVLLYARTQDRDGFKSKTTTPVVGYEYKRNPNLPYPTCVLRVAEEDILDADLVDYAFLANFAYTTPSEEEESLIDWFGDDLVRVNDTLVEEFKKSFPFDEYGLSSNSQVSYKLLQNVIDPNYVMLTIRGTATALDVMADAQLWITAMLFQAVRAFLPFGNLFTPILYRLVHFLNLIETKAIEKVSYYQETHKLVQSLIEKGFNVRVTGHSLGGGLALITGALSKVSAIGISAPNTMLSRDTFGVSASNLDTYTFNVVPNRDPVPMIDDKANLYQRINCNTSANFFDLGCHTAVRSICELQYNCGSKVSFMTDSYRPVLCECVMKFGYPPPEPLNGTDTSSSFKEKCIKQYPCKWGDKARKDSKECKA